MPKLKKKSSSKTNVYTLSILFLGIILLSFFVGLNWHRIIARRFALKKLTCLGKNSLWSTDEVDCYFPLNSNQKKFKFSRHLKCFVANNIQNGTVDKKYSSELSPEYGAIIMQKVDLGHFTLDFDFTDKKIISKRPFEEIYELTEDKESLVKSQRFTSDDNWPDGLTQNMTISKKTGSGLIVWETGNIFSVLFFQCE